MQLIADDADLRAAVSRWISLAMKSSTEPGDDEVGDLMKPGGRDTNSPRSVRRTSRLLTGHNADERTMFMRDRPTTCDDQAIAATWGRPAARWSGTLVALFI